jgi:hypothetical protein
MVIFLDGNRIWWKIERATGLIQSWAREEKWAKQRTISCEDGIAGHWGIAPQGDKELVGTDSCCKEENRRIWTKNKRTGWGIEKA